MCGINTTFTLGFDIDNKDKEDKDKEDEIVGGNNFDKQSLTISFCLSNSYRICMLGNRTLVRDRFDVCSKTVVVGNTTMHSQLWDRFCVPGNISSAQCDDYFIQNNLTEIQGIPGLGSGIIRGKLDII